MIEIECAAGGERLGAGVAAFQDCRYDFPLAGCLALVNHGDEGSGVVGDRVCGSITTVIVRQRHVAMGSRCTRVFTWSVRILNVVISRGFVPRVFIPRGWDLNPGDSSVFALNTALNSGIAN